MEEEKIIYVERPGQLEACIEHLQGREEMAVDLEFDKNMYRYGFNMCLLQIHSGDTCYLIDPLSKAMDSSRIFPLFENPRIQKVVFSFGEDLRLLHSLNCFPKNLFDLGTASRLLDYPQSSLAKTLDDYLGVQTSKAAQKSNWFKRPLSQAQLDYAAADVLHLIELKNSLIQLAEEKKVLPWLMQENTALDHLDYSGIDSNIYIREKDKNGLSEKQWFVLVNLLGLREDLAKKMNKPSYHLFSTDFLKEIVLDTGIMDNWENRKGIHGALKNKAFKAKLQNYMKQWEKEALVEGKSSTEPEVKPLGREAYREQRQEKHRMNKLKEELFKPIQRKIGESYGEHSAVFILGNRLISELSLSNTQNLLPYKRFLIENCAAELGLNIKPYLG